MQEQFFIPIAMFLIAVYCTYRGIKASKSGSTIQAKDGTEIKSNINVPFYKTFAGFCAIALFVLGAGFLIWMISDL